MINKFRQAGFFYTLGGIFNRVVPVAWFRFRWFVTFQVDPDALVHLTGNNSEGSLTQVSWCETPEDLKAIEALTYTDSQHVDSDFKIVQAKCGDRLAGALWSVEHAFAERELGIEYRLGAGQIWLFAALVATPFRRQGIYVKVLRLMCRRRQVVSVPDTVPTAPDQFLLCVNHFNKASMAAHQKFAKRKLGQACVVKILNIAVCCCWGDSVDADSMVTFNCTRRPITITFQG